MPWFVKYDGVKGSSKAKGHEGWFDAVSVQWGVSASAAAASGSGAGAARGKSTFQPILVTAPIAKNSPLLMLACAAGTTSKEVIVEFTRDGARTSQVLSGWDLADVAVTAFDVSGADGEPPIMQLFALAYGSVRMTVFEQDAKGAATSTSAGWNVRTNAKL
jgi:type VI secretion system secreted protein Hcp